MVLIRGSLFLTAALLAAGVARAAGPVAEDTMARTFQDQRKQAVAVFVPRGLEPKHRQLYGRRHGTLWSPAHRAAHYREAFLDLATQPLVQPSPGEWQRMIDRLIEENPNARQYAGTLASGIAAMEGVAKGVGSGKRPAATFSTELRRFTESVSAKRYPNLVGFSRGLSRGLGAVDFTEPFLAALQLRALATDEAERRLHVIGAMLGVDGNPADVDPAMLEGYRLARGEFRQVQKGVWATLLTALQKNQARLAWLAAKDAITARLGRWAAFGYTGLSLLEEFVDEEWQMQSTVVLATLARRLEERPAEAAPTTAYLHYTFYERLASLTEPRISDFARFTEKPAASRRRHYASRETAARQALTERSAD